MIFASELGALCCRLLSYIYRQYSTAILRLGYILQETTPPTSPRWNPRDPRLYCVPIKKIGRERSGAGLDELEDNSVDLIEIARLIEKGVRAGIKESLSILGTGKVAEDYDFGLRPRALYGFQHVDPVTVGHPEIQNHDIGPQSLDALRRFPDVG